MDCVSTFAIATKTLVFFVRQSLSYFGVAKIPRRIIVNRRPWQRAHVANARTGRNLRRMRFQLLELLLNLR
jgi:hypothetical protein